MSDVRQILAGTSELNERVQNAEARATEAERQAQVTQQELARSQAGLKGKEKGAAVATAKRARYRRVCVEVPASAVRKRGRQVERMGSSCSQVVWAIQSTNTLRDTVTIQQPSWT